MLVLSGDIGGTKTRLQLTEFQSKQNFTVIAREKYLSANYPNLTDILTLFREQYPDTNRITRACFAAAGPIVNGSVKFTNLPWFVEEHALSQALNAPCRLINDFQAIGYGVETLKAEQLHVLQKGELKVNGIKAMIGAGTGLGVAVAFFSGKHYDVMPTEGGHVDFAPTNEVQIELLKYMLKKYHRVSFERLVSGQGLINIYNFVRDNPLFNETEDPELKHALVTSKDVAAAISEFALKKDPMASRALDLFIRLYGTVAGNLALTTLPYGGLYIVGGIAPKLLPQMTDGRFLEAFTDKGRMSTLLKNIPVHIVLDSNIGLEGAAYFAARD